MIFWRNGGWRAQLPELMEPLAVSRLTKPGLHAVGGVPGLALQALKSNGRTWILRVMIGTRRREMGLGGYPGVTLTMAREAGREAQDQVRRGIDPIEAAREARAALWVTPTVAYRFHAAERSMPPSWLPLDLSRLGGRADHLS